ncbi:MAG: S8 family peptidase [Tissierellia bacterium]|nr:S8 family peptidase [Tissierellia bacterium]
MKRIINTKICPILSAKIMSQSNEELPVIVQFKNENTHLENMIMDLSPEVKLSLPIINGIACNLTTEDVYRLANSPDIEYISFDSKVFTQLDISVPTTKAQLPHQLGYKGKGITIAVIDTGVAPHSDLTKPNNRIIGFKDFINNKSTPYDDNGHGTHVAGIIAGNGYSSRGKYTGIAPESNILAIKALDKNGGGTTSNIVAALSYVLETREKYNTKILNLSFGSPANNSCSKDPLCKAVKIADNSGLIVVAAAGNSGPNPKTILSPGISPNVITVGAVDHKRTVDPSDDTIANFSSRGPTREGLAKPDVVAPGVNINSLSNINLDGYRPLSGTSMATPLVSGAVALLLNKHGSLSSRDVKKKLMDSCIDLKEEKENQGAGLVNLQNLFFDEYEREDLYEGNGKIKSCSSKDGLIENLLVLLFILFLLDKDY